MWCVVKLMSVYALVLALGMVCCLITACAASRAQSIAAYEDQSSYKEITHLLGYEDGRFFEDRKSGAIFKVFADPTGRLEAVYVCDDPMLLDQKQETWIRVE